MKKYKIKTSFKTKESEAHSIPYMIFQYGWEPVIIQQISIGFEAILENIFIFIW